MSMTDSSRRQAAAQIITGLPVFGSWVNAISEYDTPYGRAGARQMEVLWAMRHGLFPNAPITATTIATYLDVQPSVVTRVLAKLESNDFIERVGLDRDRRASEIRITERGEAIGRFVEELYYDEVLAQLAAYSDQDVEQLRIQTERLHEIGVRLLADRKRQLHEHNRSPHE